MQTGWQLLYKSWYYLNNNGIMAHGWFKIGGKWYFSKPSGVLQRGWINDGKEWYYLDGSGAMVTNKQIGKYYVGSDGVMSFKK
ncbi:hypothetical protein C3B58_16965 [Lactonifactor longoviformis]|uniref:hypothetical protein n=1 Tax=Lactonifactor longoviformis TaxID=341220 RepID=UPI000933A8A4|nr:hypothetical protein [Lactonifactor longoviformis]POP31324.1 hypothetical protein C3B58_16965 [Lactonifactor longoviformis]